MFQNEENASNNCAIFRIDWTLTQQQTRVYNHWQVINLCHLTNTLTAVNKEIKINMEKQNSFVYRIFQNVIHYSKCLIIWFVCTKIVGLWMISLNDKPNVSVISDSDLIVSYANLSKYQDTACFGDNLSFRVRLKYRIKFCIFELILY